MSSYIPYIEAIQNTQEYKYKSQVLTVVLNKLHAERKKHKSDDVLTLSAFIFSEIESLLRLIPQTASYKEKDILFDYEEKLLGVIMSIYPTPDTVPAEQLAAIKALVRMVEKERYLENAVDEMFAKDIIHGSDAENLIQTVLSVKDTYHRGQFLNGLLHYQKDPKNFEKLSTKATRVLSEYIASEMSKYLQKTDIPDEESENNLELACDVCKHFVNDDIINILYSVLQHHKKETVYYAMESLLHTGHEIPVETVVSMANDLIVANMTYHMLCRYGKQDLFPKALATPEYLAKSDLVHWLTYPTELGQAPDAIEYIGNTKVKGEVFHIFRFRSNSNELDELSKGKWLIGWSSNEGGTFSNFDEYTFYEKKTPEKTIKYIKRKLL